MAAEFKYLTFAKQPGIGNQTIAGVGFTGRALLLWSSRLTAGGATDGASLAMGMTDGIRQGCRYIGLGDNETTRSSAQAEQTDRIIFQTAPLSTVGGTPTIQNEAVFEGFNSDGFVLDWLSNDGAADIWHAIIFGGDVQAKYSPVKINVANGGSIGVTNVGFEPECFIVLGGAADEFGFGDYNNSAPYGSMHGFGFSNASANVCGWTVGFGNGTTAAAYRGQHTNRCASIRVAGSSGSRDTELCAIQIVSTNADGYVVSRVAGNLTHQPVQHILAIRGVTAALGSFNTPASAGAYALGLAFEPELLLLQTHLAGTATANDMGLALGAWSPDGSGSVWVGGVHAASPSVYARSYSSGLALEARTPNATGASSAVEVSATVTSVSPTGADLDFSVVPATPVQVLYMAFSASEAEIAECSGGGSIPVVAEPPSGETFTGRSLAPRAWLTLGFDDEDRSFALDAYNHAPDYFGGRKRGQVVSFGTIQRHLSYPGGSYRMGNASIELDDSSRFFAELEASDTADKWWNREGRIYLASKETIEAGGTPHTLFRGIWRAHGTRGLASRSIALTDLFGSEFSLFQLEQELPKRLILAEDFPDAPPESLGRVVPIIYGRWTSRVRGGAVEMTLGGVPGGYYPFGVGLGGPEVGYVPTVNGNGIELNTLVDASVRSWDVLPGTTPTSVVVAAAGAGSLPLTRNNTWTAMVTAIHDGIESDPAPVASIALGSDRALSVSWTAAAGGANGGYRIYLADNPYGVPTKFSTHWTPFLVGSDNVYVFSVGSGTTTITIAAPGTPYSFERIYLYQVSATFLDGTESAPGGVVVGMSHPFGRPIHLRWRPFDDADVTGYVIRRAPFTGIDQDPAFDRQFEVGPDGATGVQTIEGIDQLEWFDTFDDGEAAVVGETAPPRGGPIPVINAGTRIIGGVSWGRLLVSGHEITHYENCFINGVPADAALYNHSLLVDGLGATPDGYATEEINGRLYACIYAKDAVLAGHLDNSAPITLSLCGIKDADGRTITRAPRVVWHLLDQWGVQDYQTGPWSAPAESADGVQWINSQSFHELEAIEVQRLEAYRTAVGEGADDADAEGYELALYLDSPITMRQLLENRLTPDTDIYFGQNSNGQLIGIHPPDSYDADSAVHLTDVHEIVDNTPTDQRVDELEITRVYDFAFHPSSGSFVRVDEGYRNLTAFDDNRDKDARGERVQLYGTQKASQARDIARRAITRNGRPPRWATITCTLHALRVRLGSVVIVDDMDGTGAAGWTNRPLWVVGVSERLDGLDRPPLVILECVDAIWLTASAPDLALMKVPTPRKGGGGAAASSAASASWAGEIGEAGQAITGLTGDVVAGPGAGVQVATIQPGAVSYSKIQDVTALRILGRGDGAGDGPPQELELTGAVSFDGTVLEFGGGAGGGTYDDAIASPPSSPSDGELWLPPDAPVILRRDASVSPAVWRQYGPINRTADPTAAGLSTWVNQGTSAIVSSNRLLKLTGQRSGATATVAVRAYVKGFSGNKTITAGVHALVAPMANYSEGGILLRNSTSGRLETIALNYAASGAAYVCQNYLSATAYIATPGSLTSPFASLTWFRIAYTSSGSSVSIQFSYDRYNWHTLFSGSSYTLGADQWGVYVNGQQNTLDPFISFASLEET